MDTFVAVHKKQEQEPWPGAAGPEPPGLPNPAGGGRGAGRWGWPAAVLLLIGLLGYANWRLDREQRRRETREEGVALRIEYREGKNEEDVRDLIQGALRKREAETAPRVPASARSAARPRGFDFAALQASESKRRQGDVLMELGNRAGALEFYGDALRLYPPYRRAWQSMARWYLGEERDGMAQLCLETAMALGALDADTLDTLAILYRQQGRLDEALRIWDLCRALSERGGATDINEGLARLEKGDHAPAQERLEAHLARHPDDLAARRALAYSQAAAGQPLAALVTLRQALNRAPHQAVLHADAAAAAALACLPEVAAGHIERLTELTSPEVAWAFLREPAFERFCETEPGRRLENALLSHGRSSPLSRPRLLDEFRLDIGPRRAVEPAPPLRQGG